MMNRHGESVVKQSSPATFMPFPSTLEKTGLMEASQRRENGVP